MPASGYIIVKSKLRNVVPVGVSVAGDVGDALNLKVIDLVNEAVTRAQANGRNTVKAKDL